MRLCANTSCLAALGAEGAVRTIAGLGYAAVEFLVTLTLMPQDASAQRRYDLRALCADLGLAVAGLNGVLPAQGHRFLAEDERERRTGIDQLKRVIDLCTDLGGRVVTVGSVGARNWPEGVPRERWWPRALTAFDEWAHYARPCGVQVTLEIDNRYEGNWGRNIAEGLAFLGEAHPNLGLTIDSFHMNIEESSWTEPVRAAGRRIAQVHLADNQRQAPGSGILPFVELVAALRTVGYAGDLSVELFPVWSGIALRHSPEESLRQGLAFLRRSLELEST